MKKFFKFHEKKTNFSTESVAGITTFMPLAYSIANGIAFGFIAYPIVKVVAGRAKEVHWLIYMLAIISLFHFFYPA